MGRQKTQPAEFEDFSPMARQSVQTQTANPLRLSLTSESRDNGHAQMTNTTTSEQAPSHVVAQALHTRMAEDMRECAECLLDFTCMSFYDKLVHITYCVDQMSDGAESDNSNISTPPVANGHMTRDQSDTKIDEDTTSNMSGLSTLQAMSMDDSPAIVGNDSWIPTHDPDQVEMLPERREGDEEADDVTEVYKLTKLSDMKLYEYGLKKVENNGTLADHQALNCNIHQAMIELQYEYMDLQAAVITHHLPNTISIEDEQARERARVRGAPNQGLKPTQKYVDPRVKPQRSDDPTKWFYTDDWVRNEDKKEAAVYGYIYRESPNQVGHQDPIGQRPRQAGERDLRVRQPQRNAGGDADDESGEESGLNAVNDEPPEGGRGKRIKQPSSRAIPLTGSRGNSPRTKQPRKDAKTRLQPLEADPTASDTMESTGQWAKNVDAAQNGSDEEDDDEGPQKQRITAGMTDEEKKKIKSYNRSIAGKMGWVKRKAMKAENAMDSIQGSEAGDGDEGEDSASQSRKDMSEKGKRKPKAKVMIILPDGTQVEQPSAASLNMKNRWAKLREAKAKGLKAPKIGRYKKSEREAMALAASSQAANSGDDGSNATPDPADATLTKDKKRDKFTISDEVEDEKGEDDGRKKNAKPNKRPKNGAPLSGSRVVDDEDMAIVNATIDGEDEQVLVDVNGTNSKRPKRPASQEPEDAPQGQRRDTRPSPGRRRNTQSITSNEEEMNESPAKTAKTSRRATKKTIKGMNNASDPPPKRRYRTRGVLTPALVYSAEPDDILALDPEPQALPAKSRYGKRGPYKTKRKSQNLSQETVDSDDNNDDEEGESEAESRVLQAKHSVGAASKSRGTVNKRGPRGTNKTIKRSVLSQEYVHNDEDDAVNETSGFKLASPYPEDISRRQATRKAKSDPSVPPGAEPKPKRRKRADETSVEEAPPLGTTPAPPVPPPDEVPGSAGSSFRPKREIKKPKKYAEGQGLVSPIPRRLIRRSSRSLPLIPPSNVPADSTRPRIDTTIAEDDSCSPPKKALSHDNFANGNVRGGTIIDFGPLAGGPAKKNKGGRPRKSVTKSAEKVVDDPESPVTSIEENSYQGENDNPAHGHPPRDVDPKVAEALAKKEAAKKAKSEKMKAITKGTGRKLHTIIQT